MIIMVGSRFILYFLPLNGSESDFVTKLFTTGNYKNNGTLK